MIGSPSVRGKNLRNRLFPLGFLALVIVVSIIVRIRLLNVPLERDEGEHAYMAQTLLAGYAPWQLAYNLKLPGTDAMYALWMALFGQTAAAIRVGLLLTNIATVLLLTMIGRRLYGSAAGAATGACYGILSLGQGIYGTIAHSTQYVAFFAVLATWSLLKATAGWRRIFLAGFVYGLAFLAKQPGICFAGFGAVFLAWRARERAISEILRRLAIFFTAVALPWLSVCLVVWRAGTFGRFWFWTVTLSRSFAGQFTLAMRLEFLRQNIAAVTGTDVFLWILAALGLAAACWNPLTRRSALFTGAFLVFSFCSVALGGVFTPHYFVTMLPAVALACGAWTVSADRAVSSDAAPTVRLHSPIPLIILVCACAYSVMAQRAPFFQMTPYEFSRNTYGLNPFPEAVRIADYIRTHSEPGARIAVLGSEAEIYFYSKRQAATGYLFTYGLMETHRYAEQCQDEMINEIEGARPEFLIFVAIPTSWLKKLGSSHTIFDWMTDYTREHYDLAGVVELGDESRYVWGAAAKYEPVRASDYIAVYQRR